MSESEPSPPRVVIVGSINIDLVATMKALPSAGETVSASELLQIPGGKGANQAVAAAQLSATSHIIGRVGDDGFATVLQQALVDKGVNTSQVTVTQNCTSGVAMIGIDAAGENSIVIVAGANGKLTPGDIDNQTELIANADMVLVQLEVPLETVVATVAIAQQNNVPVVLDPAPAPHAPLPQELLSVDLLTPNQTEAESLTGLPVTNLQEATIAAMLLQSQGTKQVVIKMGCQGALVCDTEGVVTHVAAPVVDVIDTTAAGDAFTAAMAVRWAEGVSLVDAVRFACVAGALATTKLGAQPSMPTREDVDKISVTKRLPAESG